MQLTDDQILYDYAMRLSGTPYLYGGNTPLDGGVDCSGLVLMLLEARGQWPNGRDASAHEVFQTLSAQGWKPVPARFGALVFYGTPVRVSHIAFCLNDRLMIEAGGGDETTTTREAAAKRQALVRVRPIDRRKDLVAVLAG